jgi:hypothetical protein
VIGYVLNGKRVSREEWLAGSESRLGMMLEAGQPPAANTDREFLQGHCNGNQFEKNPALGDFYAEDARASGVDTKGKVYLSGLAAYPGDPRAWINNRGDVQKLIEERGWKCQGSVNVNAIRPEERKPVAVADDILDDAVLEAIEAGATEPVEELREQALERLKPPWGITDG